MGRVMALPTTRWVVRGLVSGRFREAARVGGTSKIMPNPERPLIDTPHDSVLNRPALTVPEAIARNAVVPRFEPEKPVPVALLKAILHLATLATSEQDLQPWRFIVVRRARNRERLWACVERSRELLEAPVALVVLGYRNPSVSDLEPMIERRERLGVISREAGFAIRSSVRRSIERREDPAGWAARSSLRAAVTLTIAAAGFGVASGLTERFDEPRLREAFGIPDDHSVGCLIALGFAREQPPFPGRFGLGHVAFEEHFGQPWALGELDDRDAETLEVDPSGVLA